MSLVEVTPRGLVQLTPAYFAFAEAAVGSIGDQQVAMGLPQAEHRPSGHIRIVKSTRCPFCDADGFTVRVVWRDGAGTAYGLCETCGTRSESRWIRESRG